MSHLNNLIVSVFLFTLVASGTALSSYAQEVIPPSNEFLSPNEVNPELASQILAHAPTGAYITVGTERGFIHAAQAPEVTHLFLVDRAPGTVLFNQINIELLVAASQPEMTITQRRERYRFLRLEATFEEWQKVSGTAAHLPVKEYYDWFTKAARGRGFLDFNAPPKKTHLAAFRNSNYLYDDQMFEKLQNMALSGKIEAQQLDFGSVYGQFHESEVRVFLKRLESRNIPISVFDLSNAWSRKYLSPKWTAELMKTLAASPMARPNSIFVVTDYRRTQYYKNGERTKAPWFTSQAAAYETNAHYEYDWEYHGYSFGYLLDHPVLKVLDSSFLKGTTLDGRPLGCESALLN